MQLRVASYNIHKAVGTDRRRDPDRIIAVLRELDADIIALQEADLRVGARASVLPRSLLDDTPWKVAPVARRPRSIGWHGNAMLVRRDIDIVQSEALELPTLEPRGAICVRIDTGSGVAAIYGTHLDLSGLRRRDQIRAMLDHHRKAGSPNALMLGDFNQWGISSGAMTEFGPDWQPVAPGKTFPSRQPIASLDRVVASDKWQIEKAGVWHSALASAASDHLPVWATATLPIN